MVKNERNCGGINQNAPHFAANVPNAHEMGCVLIDSQVRFGRFFTVTLLMGRIGEGIWHSLSPVYLPLGLWSLYFSTAESINAIPQSGFLCFPRQTAQLLPSTGFQCFPLSFPFLLPRLLQLSVPRRILKIH